MGPKKRIDLIFILEAVHVDKGYKISELIRFLIGFNQNGHGNLMLSLKSRLRSALRSVEAKHYFSREGAVEEEDSPLLKKGKHGFAHFYSGQACQDCIFKEDKPLLYGIYILLGHAIEKLYCAEEQEKNKLEEPHFWQGFVDRLCNGRLPSEDYLNGENHFWHTKSQAKSTFLTKMAEVVRDDNFILFRTMERLQTRMDEAFKLESSVIHNLFDPITLKVAQTGFIEVLKYRPLSILEKKQTASTEPVVDRAQDNSVNLSEESISQNKKVEPPEVSPSNQSEAGQDQALVAEAKSQLKEQTRTSISSKVNDFWKSVKQQKAAFILTILAALGGFVYLGANFFEITENPSNRILREQGPAAFKLSVQDQNDLEIQVFNNARALAESGDLKAANANYKYVAEMTQDERLKAGCFYYLSQNLFLLKELEEAEKSASLALASFKQQALWIPVANSLLILAKIYAEKGNYDLALEALDSAQNNYEARAFSIEPSLLKSYTASVMEFKATVNFQMENYNSARVLLLDANELRSSSGDVFFLFQNHLFLSEISAVTEDQDAFEEHLKMAQDTGAHLIHKRLDFQFRIISLYREDCHSQEFKEKVHTLQENLENVQYESLKTLLTDTLINKGCNN